MFFSKNDCSYFTQCSFDSMFKVSQTSEEISQKSGGGFSALSEDSRGVSITVVTVTIIPQTDWRVSLMVIWSSGFTLGGSPSRDHRSSQKFQPSQKDPTCIYNRWISLGSSITFISNQTVVQQKHSQYKVTVYSFRQ